jgi:hypothetical protein
VKCPNCGSPVTAGAVICDRCNHILDTSFLGDDFTGAGGAGAAGKGGGTRRSQVPKAPPSAVELGAQAAAEGWADLLQTWRGLPSWDRLATAAAAALVATLVLPWRWTREDGQLLGFFADGWPALVLGIAVLAIAYARTLERMRPYARMLARAQAVAALLAAVYCVAYIPAVNERVSMRRFGEAVVLSRPDFGVFLALVAGGLAAAGSLRALYRQ